MFASRGARARERERLPQQAYFSLFERRRLDRMMNRLLQLLLLLLRLTLISDAPVKRVFWSWTRAMETSFSRSERWMSCISHPSLSLSLTEMCRWLERDLENWTSWPVLAVKTRFSLPFQVLLHLSSPLWSFVLRQDAATAAVRSFRAREAS